jgi:hypothetical protein
MNRYLYRLLRVGTSGFSGRSADLAHDPGMHHVSSFSKKQRILGGFLKTLPQIPIESRSINRIKRSSSC